MHGTSCAAEHQALGAGRLKGIAVICAVTMLLGGCDSGNRPLTGKPPTQGPAHKVHLIWKPATNEWMVQLNGGPEVKPAQARSKIDKDIGPTMFEVSIQGSATATFKNSGALSVWEGAKSQPQQGINSTQIIGPIVSQDRKTLVFFDLNYGAPVTLNYELQFNSGPKVDPIIDNGGGNW